MTTRFGDSDSIDSGDGEYIGGTTSTHLQTMNFKTLVAPVAALTLLIGGMVSTPEVKAETMWRDPFNHTTPSAVAPLTTTATTPNSATTTSTGTLFTSRPSKTVTGIFMTVAL